MAWTVTASQCGHWVEVWLPFFQYYFLVIYLIATVTTNATTTTTTTTTANTTIIIYTAVTVATTITTTTNTVISIIQTTTVTSIIYLSYIFMGTSAKNHIIILCSTRIFFVIWVLKSLTASTTALVPSSMNTTTYVHLSPIRKKV